MKSLKTWAGTNVSRLLTPKFFFWSPGSPMQKSSVGLLRSLLYQIFREYPALAPVLGSNEPLSDWTERRLGNIFQSITHDVKSSYRMCLFIDGLDEFSGDHDALITMFGDLVQNVNIKIVLSSRPYPKFDRAFGSSAMLKLQDLTRADIKKFVSDRLLAYPRIQAMAAQEPQNIFEGTIPRIIHDIVENSDGVFLWVDLAVKDQIRGISDEDSPEQLKERLRNLPTTLEDLYAHMLNKIDKAHRKEAAWFLQFALHPHSRSLLDFTLAVHESLDRDLKSSAAFPSLNVISHCQVTERRITTTCAGLLEIKAPPPNSRHAFLADDTTVVFLHRTAADFVVESEQARNFLEINTPPTPNVYEVWAKVLVARLRMLGLNCSNSYVSIEDIMQGIYDAEYETGVAQTAVCDYLNLAMTILDRERERIHPESHWCTRIHDWASRDSSAYWHELQEYNEQILFHSASNQFEEGVIPRRVPQTPIDYLGFAASYPLRLYIEQQMKSFSADYHAHVASYLLCCVVCSRFLNPSSTPLNLHWRIHGLPLEKHYDLILTLLSYGADPNVPVLKSTIWGCFLDVMFYKKAAHRMLKDPFVDEKACKAVLECFIEHGADVDGILDTGDTPGSHFQVNERHLQELSDCSSKIKEMLRYECVFCFRFNMSVPTLIRYCLGASPMSTELLSTCMRKGALLHSKWTEISISFNGVREYETWALSKQQSDRMLQAFERYIMPNEHPPLRIVYELRCQILRLYDELSTKGLPPRITRKDSWRELRFD